MHYEGEVIRASLVAYWEREREREREREILKFLNGGKREGEEREEIERPKRNESSHELLTCLNEVSNFWALDQLNG